MVGPTIYFLCLSLSKLQTPFILLNRDDLNTVLTCALMTHVKQPKESNFALENMICQHLR